MTNKAFLFDLDGVLIDSEPCYDTFWEDAAHRYNIPIPNFPSVIKGTTLKAILEKYFSGYPTETVEQLKQESSDFEINMDYSTIPGALEIVRLFKSLNCQVGLVTSSDNRKVKSVISRLALENTFDSIVTADRISEGKPNPECYLLAAQDLGKKPDNCVVFEDSFAGIEAGRRAGMKVIALSTTNPPHQLQNKANIIIPNFEGITEKTIASWIV